MNEADKRLDGTEKRGYTTIDELPDDWHSYDIQRIANGDGAPSEQAIRLITTSIGRDIAIGDKKLVKKEPEIVERGLEPEAQAPNTVTSEDYEDMLDVELMEF